MAPKDKLNRRIRELRQQGCTQHEAVKIARAEFDKLSKKAAKKKRSYQRAAAAAQYPKGFSDKSNKGASRNSNSAGLIAFISVMVLVVALYILFAR